MININYLANETNDQMEQFSQSIRNGTAANRRRRISEAIEQTNRRIEKKDDTINEDNLKEQLKELAVPLSKKVELLKKFNLKSRQKHNSIASIRYKKSMASEMRAGLIRFKQLFTVIILQDLWKSHIKTIHKQFGSHIAYYFYLLRWLFFINLLGSVITFFFLILPQIVYDLKEDISLLKGMKNSIIKDCELNENGFINGIKNFFRENSILYYGHYGSSSWSKGMPFAYLAVIGVYITINLILTARKLGHNYGKKYIIEKTYRTQHKDFASKVFTSWRFMSCASSVELQHKQMIYDIRVSSQYFYQFKNLSNSDPKSLNFIK